jgi:acetylornithine deacetylase/succinyl-diaminopimelate desuccinylase-like protein
VRGGRVYGAGASDMLGGVAATIVSVRDLLDRTALSGRITVQLVVGGHPHGEGVTDLCGRAGLPGADLAVLTEPTDRQVCTTAYGYGSHRLSSVGAPGAMAFSNDGDNAATHAATALLALNAANGWLQELYPTRQDIRYIMPGRIHAGQSAPAPAVEAYVDFAMALPPLLPEEVALDVIRQNMLDRFTVAGMPLPVWERTGPRLLPADLGHSAFAKLLRDVNPALGWGQYPCPSDARAFQDAGIPIVVYGPGDLCRSRRPGEYVEVDELHEFVTTFATALGRQLSDGGER